MEKLQDERALLSAVLETSLAAICVLDTAGCIVFANPAAEQILGLRVSDMVGRRYDDPPWRATALDGGPWLDEQQPFTRVMRSGEPVTGVRHAIEWPDGRRKLLSIDAAPLKDAVGRVAMLRERGAQLLREPFSSAELVSQVAQLLGKACATGKS